MERLTLAVFDIKPLQFSQEQEKKLCTDSFFYFFFSEAISGFREKGDKWLSRNVGRLKLQYIYFFVIHWFQKPKMGSVVFFLWVCVCVCPGLWYFKAPVYFEDDGSSKLKESKKKKKKNRVRRSRNLTRPVKVLGLSHYLWSSVKTCSKTPLKPTRINPFWSLLLPSWVLVFSPSLITFLCLSLIPLKWFWISKMHWN